MSKSSVATISLVFSSVAVIKAYAAVTEAAAAAAAGDWRSRG